jgi:hypothetical protein
MKVHSILSYTLSSGFLQQEGNAYKALGKTKEAKADFAKAKFLEK